MEAGTSAPGASADPVVGCSGPTTLDELYTLNAVPSELFFKFRKEVEGLRVGLNLEFYNYEINEYEAKLVVKPLNIDRRWKLIMKPVHGDIQLFSKKIPVTKYLNLQLGVGHNFYRNALGWKWKLTTCLGGEGASELKTKTKIGLFPGFDIRIGWRAEYVLPEVQGAVGTGEAAFSMNYGRLHASIDRIETILTHAG